MVVREFVNLIGFKVNETQLKRTEGRVKNITRKLGNIGTKMSAFVSLPILALNVGIAKTLSRFEQIDVAFETLIGDAEKAQDVLSELYQLAATTPFEVLEITDTARQLVAVGIEVDNVKDTLIDLGNVASGLSNVSLSRLALNFGQVKAQGKLTGRELRDFAVAGVPLLATLANQMGKTTKQILKMVSAGAIGFDDVAKAFRFMARQGKFADLMIKQSKTLGGLWSNFKDIIALTVRKMSNELLPIFKRVVTVLIKMVGVFDRLNPKMKKGLFFFSALLGVVGPLSLAISIIGKAFLLVNIKLVAIVAAIGAVTAGIGLLIEDIKVFVSGGRSLIGKFLPPWDMLKKKFDDFFKATKFYFKDFLAGVKIVKDGIDLIVTGAKYGFDDFLKIGEIKVSEGFEKIVNSILKVISSVITKLIPPLISIVAKLTPVFFKIGFSIGQGIIKGILSAFEKNVLLGSLLSPAFFQKKVFDISKTIGTDIGSFTKERFSGLKSLLGFGGTGTSGGTNSTVNTTVNVEIPKGTSQQQADFIKETAEKTFGIFGRRIYLAGAGGAE